jgi:hypothetical protein
VAQPEKQRETPTMTDTRKTNRPSHTLWMEEDLGNGKTSRTEIGALWAHKTGGGFNLSLKALPLAKDARLVIFPRKAKAQPTEEAGQ